MSANERMLASAAGRWCSAGASLAWVSVALAMLAFVVLVFDQARGATAWTWWLVAVLGGVGAWYRFRLVFDAGVFRDLAGPERDEAVAPRIAAFDASLAMLLGRSPAASASRSLAERVRGASRLVVAAGTIVVVQLVAALITTLPR